MPFDLQVRYVSFRLGPSRYLRFCSRVLTASRALGTDALPFSPRDITLSPEEILEVFRVDKRAATDLYQREFAFVDQRVESGGADAAELVPASLTGIRCRIWFLSHHGHRPKSSAGTSGRSTTRAGGGAGRSRSTAACTASSMRSRSASASRSAASLIAAVSVRQSVETCCDPTTPRRRTIGTVPGCRA